MMTHRSIYVIGLWVGMMLIGGFTTSSVAAERYGYEPQRVVDAPTAGMIDRDRLSLSTRTYDGGGTMVFLMYGIKAGKTQAFAVGFSVGADSLVGNGSMKARFNVQAKFRFWNEEHDTWKPALAAGLDMQGYGPYSEEYERYQYKSKGLYGVVSKNWHLGYLNDSNFSFGNLGLHFGLNYAFEQRKDEETGFNAFWGFDKVLWERSVIIKDPCTDRSTRVSQPVVELMGEYDFGLNDDRPDGRFGEPGRQGYLNAGLRVFLFSRWEPEMSQLKPSLILELYARNLNKNNGDVSREFGLSFQTDLQFRIN